MFYNGSNKEAHWRIGWVKMNETGEIIQRSKIPLIVPPKTKLNETDIAFAASAVLVNKNIWLYYTTADKTIFRSVINSE